MLHYCNNAELYSTGVEDGQDMVSYERKVFVDKNINIDPEEEDGDQGSIHVDFRSRGFMDFRSTLT